MQTFKRDYAKNKTIFSEEFERKRELLMLEISNLVVAKGFINRVLHKVFNKPFLGFN